MHRGCRAFTMLLRGLALLLGAASAAAEVAQSDDWLVSAGPSKKAALTVTKDASGATTELSLANGLVQRAFTVRGGALCTTEYKNLVSEQTFFRAISPEVNLRQWDRLRRGGVRRPAEQDDGVLDPR